MLKWTKAGETANSDGGKTIIYRAQGQRAVIESRRKAIPHAPGRSGVWYHTTYFVVWPDGREQEYMRLVDAKEALNHED